MAETETTDNTPSHLNMPKRIHLRRFFDSDGNEYFLKRFDIMTDKRFRGISPTDYQFPTYKKQNYGRNK